jgi:hypothetical protein
VIIDLLAKLNRADESFAVPKHLEDYISDIRWLFINPDTYAPTQEKIFIDILHQRIAAKIIELSGMSNQQRRDLITRSILRSVEVHSAQIDLQRRQFPLEFLSLPCPDLIAELTEPQLAALEMHQRELLENSSIRRLVGCRKLSLKKLISADEVAADSFGDSRLLNLFYLDILDETMFYQLDYSQRQSLTSDSAIYELIKDKTLPLEDAVKLNYFQRALLAKPIIAYCLKKGFISLDTVLNLECDQAFAIEDYQEQIIHREKDVSELIHPTFPCN